MAHSAPDTKKATTHTYEPAQLLEFSRQVFESCGVPSEEAALPARGLARRERRAHL